MKKDLTIVLPSIRPQNLVKFCNSLVNSCKRNSFDLIVIGPYLPPEELMTLNNFRFIHSYSSPTVAFQQGALLANSEFIMNTSDDGLLQEDALDLAFDFFKSGLQDKDIINMTYKEGVLDDVTLEPLNNHASYHPPEYWNAHFHDDLRLPGINKEWKLCLQFFMKLSRFVEMGGFDCQFEFSNHALHDLAFRMQANGSVIYNSKVDGYLGSHLPSYAKDHRPVHDAQKIHDSLIFNEMYSQPNDRGAINYDNWKSQPLIWRRRFNQKLPIHPPIF